MLFGPANVTSVTVVWNVISFALVRVSVTTPHVTVDLMVIVVTGVRQEDVRDITRIVLDMEIAMLPLVNVFVKRGGKV